MDFHLINLDCPACLEISKFTLWEHDNLTHQSGSGAVLGNTELNLVDSPALMPVPGRRATLWRPG